MIGKGATNCSPQTCNAGRDRCTARKRARRPRHNPKTPQRRTGLIIVEGWVRLESPGEVERLRAAALEMMSATKSQEPGCLEYAYAVDLGDPTLLRIIERWTDDDALTAHFATPHMAAFGQAMAGAKIASTSVKAYSAEVARTLMER